MDNSKTGDQNIRPGEVFTDINYYDQGIRNIVPYYDLMTDVILQCIPIGVKSILELGCGTGELTLKLLVHHSEAHLICIDYSQRMLSLAKQKIQKSNFSDRVNFIEDDYGMLDITDSKIKQLCPFDACVASLTIHHLPDKLKQSLFKNIYSLLTYSGCLWIADPVKPESQYIEIAYQQARERWAIQNAIDMSTIRKRMAKTQPYRSSGHDRLATIDSHISMLRIAGFKTIAIPWKYYGIAVIGGIK